MSSHVFTEFMVEVIYIEPHKLSMELPRHIPMAPFAFASGLGSSLAEKDRSHDVSRDLGLFNKPCRQSTQLAYGSRLLLPHETLTLRNKSAGSWKNLELQIQLFTSIYRGQLVQHNHLLHSCKIQSPKHDLSPTSGLCLWFFLGWLLFFGRFRGLQNWRRSSKPLSKEQRKQGRKRKKP